MLQLSPGARVRAILFGGPVEGRVIENVPVMTQNITIPSNKPGKSAHYRRVADERDAKGRYMRFDFTAVNDVGPVG